MNEPITPKAEHHVVEGEFVDADAARPEDDSAKQAKAKAKASKPSFSRNAKQPWLAMLAMTGILLGGSSWIALEQRTANLYEMAKVGLVSEATMEQQIQQQLEPLVQKIAYQQQKINNLEDWQASFQGGARSFLNDFEALEIQLSEMQVLLGAHSQQLSKLNLAATSPGLLNDDSFELAVTEWDEEAVRIEIQAALRHLNQQLLLAQTQLDEGLGQLRSELERLEQQAGVAAAGLQQLSEAPQWQAGHDQLAEQMSDFKQRLAELALDQAQFQADWLSKLEPEINAVVTEVTPTFEGILSRFNHLFNLRKIEPEMTTSDETVGEAP